MDKSDYYEKDILESYNNDEWESVEALENKKEKYAQYAKKTGFSSVSQKDAEILILGSMPGEQSLLKAQYYGHPRNIFWRIMGELLGFDPEIEYENRLNKLKENKIALWDVLMVCERKGSLDSSIVSESEVANDFNSFFLVHNKIQKICFNGQKAHQTFLKHVLKKSPQITNNIKLYILPSTSPANASISFEKKFIEWEKALR